MNNLEELNIWLKDAEDCLQRAERCLQVDDWRGVVQNAQLCIELSAKAVISYYAEPEWTHNPKKQLIAILKDRERELLEKLGQQIIQRLYCLAEDSEEASPWHGRSTYGDERVTRIAAVDLCTKEVAENLIKKARKSFESAISFSQAIL